MKKAISLILALAICFALCACGSNQSANTENTKATTTAVTENVPVAYDKTDMDSILAFIASEAVAYEDVVTSEAATLIEKLGDTYESYNDNKDSIPAYYESTMTHASAFFTSVQTASIDYCKCYAAQGLGDYDDWDNALEDLYDAWDDAYEDFYDAWDEAYEDIYSKCDNLLEDAADELSYDEYSEVWSTMYNTHSDAWSVMYNAHSDAWSVSYNNQSDIWGGFYNGETDIDAILMAAAEEDAQKAAEATTQPVETEVETQPEETQVVTQPVATEAETQPVETEATTQTTEYNDTPATGIRPDFKEAMDAYEAFYTEYCEFLVEYSENPADFTLLAKYGELLIKAEQMDEAFAKWESEDLTDEELKYYLDVQNRVMKMLVDVA